MIWWLFGHAWWGLPALLVLIAAAFALLGAWPLLVGILGRLPPRVQVLLLVLGGALVASSGLYAVGLEHGRERCQHAQEAAETGADAKAIRVAKDAGVKADEARATFQKETNDVQVRIREVVRTVPATCPPMPDELRELLQRQVEGARDAVPAGAGRSDR